MAIEDIQDVVASRVRDARALMGITQAQLGEQLGLSWQTVSRWERGKKLPAIMEIARLAELSGRPPDWFLRPGEYLPGVSPHDAMDVLTAYFKELRTKDQGG